MCQLRSYDCSIPVVWDEAMEQRANELETEVMDLQRCLHLAQSQAWQGTRHVGMGWMGGLVGKWDVSG